MENLQEIAKEVYRTAHGKYLNGGVPTYLGVTGMLALLTRDIQDYIKHPTRNALLSLVANGLFALAIETEKDEWSEIENQIEKDEEDIVEEKENTIDITTMALEAGINITSEKNINKDEIEDIDQKEVAEDIPPGDEEEVDSEKST